MCARTPSSRCSKRGLGVGSLVGLAAIGLSDHRNPRLPDSDLSPFAPELSVLPVLLSLCARRGANARCPERFLACVLALGAVQSVECRGR